MAELRAVPLREEDYHAWPDVQKMQNRVQVPGIFYRRSVHGSYLIMKGVRLKEGANNG